MRCYGRGCDDDTVLQPLSPEVASIMDQAPDAILLLDVHGAILYANRCVEELFGFPTTAVVGQSIERVIPTAASQGLLAAWASGLEVVGPAPIGTDSRVTLIGRHREGREFPVDVHFAPVKRGSHLWIMAVVRDATEQARILDEARAAKRAAEEIARIKGEFLGFAAHDLSQPVQTLELMITAIEQSARKSGELAEISALATISLARMRELLRMLLEISRIDSGGLSIHEEPVQIAEIFGYLERQFGPIARAKALTFVAEPSAHIIEADPRLLRGMLANLVSNAIRYTQHGEVRLQAGMEASGDLSLGVRDTGIGIPSDQFPTIFQDFRRLSDGERMSSEGFGLGLGIVRRLSSLLRFPVTVQSRVGSGSTFRVAIPGAKVFGRV